MKKSIPSLLIFFLSYSFMGCGMVKDYKTSQKFAQKTVQAVLPHWDQEAMLDRFADQALEGTTEKDIKILFDGYRKQFGKVVNIGEATGKIKDKSTLGIKGKNSSAVAVFTIPVEFQTRNGNVILVVQKFGDHWLLTGFRIRPTTAPLPEKGDNSKV